MTAKATANEVLELDLNEIYLGNLSTVDCDLKLPKKGKRGTVFSWTSNEILFIGHDGKVTRPTYGVGNREVVLTVTGQIEEDSLQKKFIATVLEETPETKIVKVENLSISLKEAVKHLPTVCVALLDNGNYTTAEISWSDQLDLTKKKQTLTGKLKETALVVSMEVVDKSESCQQPIKVTHSLSTQLTETSTFREASTNMIEHLKTISLDQLLYNFREAAGLSTQNAKPMTGWDAPECNLKGHTTGHYLSAFALAAYSTQDQLFFEKVNVLIENLAECQQAHEKLGRHRGFLSAYSEEQFNLLERFTTYPTIWAPYYTLDKLFQGCLDCYEFANSEKALDIAKKIGDWTFERLSKLNSDQLNRMWSIYIAGEFGGMISALTRLYHFTNDEKFLETAKLFENDKLFVPMQNNFDTLDGVHANQHIPQIIGALDLYEETGETRYFEIAKNFWQMVTQHHTYSIGGVGETEMFKTSDAIACYLTTKSAESCASHNLLKLTRKLFDLSPNADYFDYYENVLHNHLLSACSHDHSGGTTYFMPTSPGAQKHYDTEENTCCHGTGLESLLRFQKDIYAFSDEALYVNLFYPSQVSWLEKGAEITQKISSNTIQLHWRTNKPFELKVRLPSWADFNNIQINDREVPVVVRDSYLSLDVTEDGDMSIHYQLKNSVIPANDDSTYFSIRHGRDIIVLLSDKQDFQTIDLESELIDSDDGICLDDQVFIPLNQVENESYHLYFKAK